MRATVPFRRQPTFFERVLGRRRARVLRRRFGLLFIGFGVSLVKPRLGAAHVAVSLAIAVVAVSALALLGH